MNAKADTPATTGDMTGTDGFDAEDLRELKAMRRLWRAGYAAVALSVAALAGSGAWATIRGAVIAPGQVVVESNVRRVQHPSGGVVAKILVGEGQAVEAGQPLLRLDPTAVRAAFEIARKQHDDLAIRKLRLEAERDRRTLVVLSTQLAARAHEPGIAAQLREEQSFLESRVSIREGQIEQGKSRIRQMGAEITGYQRQLGARERELLVVNRDLDGVRKLSQRNLVPLSRLSQLEREQAVLEGHTGQLMAQIAQTQGRIAEAQTQIVQTEDSYRNEVTRELGETSGRLAEMTERLTAAEDLHARAEMRAPVAGRVLQLAVHTEGGVIGAGETAMLILPSGDPLNLEAKVSPQDVDLLKVGQAATIRLHAFNTRTTPELTATVSRIAGDITRDQPNGTPHYVVRLQLSPEQLDRIAPERLVPGMQADVLIETTDRTLFSYLIKPIKDQFARALRER